MTGFLGFLATVVGFGLLGWISHELAHYLFAWSVGREDRHIDWRSATVTWRLPESGPNANDAAIALSPLALGVSLMLAAATAEVLSIGVLAYCGGLTAFTSRCDLAIAIAGYRSNDTTPAEQTTRQRTVDDSECDARQG